MNIVLLGNGYDLNYKLLTSYRSFLLTIDFLRKQKVDKIHSVGDVYGDSALNAMDRAIKESYELYKEIYDKVLLEEKIVRRITDLANKNLWFRYFANSFNKDVGWIDFETEIAYVLDCFQSVLMQSDTSIVVDRILRDRGEKYIILSAFSFFLKEKGEENAWQVGVRTVKDEYSIEKPPHSRNKVIDKKKIVDFLYVEWIDFVEMLRLYLRYFVDASTEILVRESKILPLDVLKYTDVTITFNYTNTHEYFAPDEEVFHIHGDLHSNIVLGINSDKFDEIENMDTLFVAFKKYYQRALYDTDVRYLRWIREQLDENVEHNDLHLVIFGHSLDVTDKDVIEDLIGMASKITVFCHNDYAKAQYIQKLVAIFGRSKFEQLRDEQELRFLPTSIDPSEFAEEMNQNSSLQYMRNFATSAVDTLVFD